MGIAHSEYAEDRTRAARDVDWLQRQHSSEALATTSNTEVEAPDSPPREKYWRDRIEQYLTDDPNVGSVGAINEDVIGFEDIDTGDHYFMKIELA